MSVNVGDVAPAFNLKNQFGESVQGSDYAGKSAVALVFFPLAFSGICTGELCELRDNIEAFKSEGISLIGISVDSHFAQRAFADHEHFDFPLLADFWPHGDVARAYGVFVEEAGIANRATFLINKTGQVAATFITEPGVARDLTQYREAIATLAA